MLICIIYMIQKFRSSIENNIVSHSLSLPHSIVHNILGIDKKLLYSNLLYVHFTYYCLLFYLVYKPITKLIYIFFKIY